MYESSAEKKKASAIDKFAAVVQAASENHAGSETGRLLQQLIGNTTVPRKRKAFLNFCGNSLRIRNPKQSEALWDAIDVERQKAAKLAEEEAKQAKAAKEAAKAAAAKEAEKPSKKSKKEKKEKKEKKSKSGKKRSRDEMESSGKGDEDSQKASGPASGAGADEPSPSPGSPSKGAEAALKCLQRAAKKARVDLVAVATGSKGEDSDSSEVVRAASKRLWKKAGGVEGMGIATKEEAKAAVLARLQSIKTS